MNECLKKSELEINIVNFVQYKASKLNKIK